jgi:hypothetical protein
MGIRFRGAELVAAAVAAAAAAAWVDDWLGGAAIIVLWLGVRLLLTEDNIPVLPAAFMFQWMQVTIGMFYTAGTGRPLPANSIDYRPMVMIGLGCVLALAVGLRLGIYLIRDERENRDERPVALLTMPMLLGFYLASVALEGPILGLINTNPSLRQILVTLTVVRMGLLFLVMRRFCQPVFRPQLLAAILSVEVVLGLTGYFAGFRDPLVLAALVMFEVFDYRQTVHWVSLSAIVLMGALLAVMWMGVRSQYRKEVDTLDPLVSSTGNRVGRINALGTEFFSAETGQFRNTTDSLIDRMWTVYYPALAVARVPSVLDHTGGSIIQAAILHVMTPRIFFPDKAALPSDSDMVRKYSGVFVAGADSGTSIAFGYAAESYIDFGIPGMFLPIFVFGIIEGALYAWFLRTIWHRELAVSVVIVMFWLSLYLFERSWANMLGMAASLVVYLGLPITLLDWFLVTRQKRAQDRVDPEAAFQARWNTKSG